MKSLNSGKFVEVLVVYFEAESIMVALKNKNGTM